MKRFLFLTIGTLLFNPFTKCSQSESKPDFDITTEFAFAKDGEKNEFFDTTTFEINTKIYVCVDFSITKNAPEEETISFVVQIPYAEYYSTKDYYSGTIKPKEDTYLEQDLNGNKYTVVELTQMNFVIDDDKTHEFHYVFEIEANQPCESADFRVRFKPENTNLHNVFVNGEKTNKAQTSYTFITAGV